MQQQEFGAATTAEEVLADQQLADKTAIVTGANTGIGFESARALAAAGARVIFACRNATSGAEAVANTRRQHPGCNAKFLSLDLASPASIETFCTALTADKVDILICNAGLAPTHYAETELGIESTVGVSHFGHFQLVGGLLSRLLTAPAPRVVMVSSESHKMPKQLQFERFPMSRDQFKFLVAYGQAKLCNILFANELQRRYGAQNLTACALHPGTLITTDIGRSSSLIRFFMKAISPFTKTPNQGAATSLYCATHEPAADVQGKYLSHCKVVRSSAESKNAAVAAKLWALSEKYCGEFGGSG